jgi:hypothetical protein
VHRKRRGGDEKTCNCYCNCNSNKAPYSPTTKTKTTKNDYCSRQDGSYNMYDVLVIMNGLY